MTASQCWLYGAARTMRKRGALARRVVTIVVAVLLSVTSSAEESPATLFLDSNSYIAYGDSETLRVPSGSRIQFRLGSPIPDGSIPLTVKPSGLSMSPIPIAQGAAIEYTLGETATGTLRAKDGGQEIELFATLVATLQGRPEVPAVTYSLRLTTGRVQAESADRTSAIAIDGVGASPSNAVQLVGAATNRPDAYPGPGEVVYAVLSGHFDWLPTLR